MSMKHIGTKILAGVLVVLLAGTGVLIWRNLPEDAPRLQEPEETVRQEPEVQPDTTATLCVAGDIVAHMPLVADAWNGEAYDFTHLFADARRYYEAADYTTACLETTFNGPPYSGYPQFCAPDALASGLKTVGFSPALHGEQPQHGYRVQRSGPHTGCAGRPPVWSTLAL